MLHEGSKQVVNEFGGVLPDTVDGLLRIKGVGPYTAGAVASIAHGVAAPVVDGNVLRLLSRLCAIATSPKESAFCADGKLSWVLAERLVKAGGGKRAGELNQAMMELGATLCAPGGSGTDVRDPLQGLQELTNGAAGFPIDFQLEKVYFHWSTRSQQSLGWFTDMMNDLCEQDDDGMLTMYNYLTSVKLAGERKSVLDIARQGAKDATGREAVTGLKADHINLIFARPDFDKTFQDMREKHPNTKIGVFFCGPKVIKNMLAKCCRKYSGKGDNETRFKLHAENF